MDPDECRCAIGRFDEHDGDLVVVGDLTVGQRRGGRMGQGGISSWGSYERFVTRALIVAAATLGIVFAQIAPASATVHEIVAQWCSRGASGKGALGPAGISDPTKRNFAQPLNASRFIGATVPFDPPGDQLPGLLIKFNYDNPNVKVVGTGNYVQIGQVGVQPLYIEEITPDSSFAAFQRCPNLVTTD